MTAAAILHVTSLFGGGVDRHVRDILRTVERPQLVWHAGDDADVIEDPREGRFFPLAAHAIERHAGGLADWLKARGVGLVHLHQLTRAPRRRCEWACEALGVPRIATLHDILFLRPDAFAAADPLAADAGWLADTSRALLASRAVLAPSRWLAGLAESRVPGLRVEVVPNGSQTDTGTARSAPREEFARHRVERVVALLGALGPHKGSDFVDEIAACLEGTGIALVVIGYLERQLHPGWRVPGRLFVHGAFAEGDAAALLRGYGASLVVMPNETPESFSYALSDAWAAGVPVLAAPRGALAERIAAHGGGWLLPERFDAAFVAARIRTLAGGPEESERARVQSRLALPDAARIPSLDTMTRSLDAYYARFGVDPAAPGTASPAQIESLLAMNLDGSLFRKELVRLSDELSQTLAALEDTKRRGVAFETEAREWIAKLEGDLRTVQEDARQAAQLAAAETQRIAAQADSLAKEVDLLRLNKEALERLPSPLRRLLLKLAFDARR